MSIRIRPGDAADIDAAVDVFERSNSARREGVWPHRPASMARMRGKLRNADSWLLLAMDGREPVAMASAEASRATTDGCFLSYLFVVPERWGEGIGGLILDALLAEARRRRHSYIHLWTHDHNPRSHRLYRSRGFLPTGKVDNGEGEWAREL
jgi:GNAT superfamily N-acetyltransferase